MSRKKTNCHHLKGFVTRAVSKQTSFLQRRNGNSFVFDLYREEMNSDVEIIDPGISFLFHNFK